MKKILYTVLVLLLMSQTGWSDDKSAAKELLETKIQAALAVLQKKDLGQQEKNKEVVKIVEPIFDYNLMAKLTLGRKYWPGLSEKNRERFVDLFVARLKTSYIDKLSLYTDEKVAYDTPVQEGIKIQIPTSVISKNNSIAMMYKLYKSSNSWKIYDIEIEGVSLISTYRSQFYDILSKGTIDDLLLKLEKPEIK
ncbi:MAG: ABC transporter substrate-binding protein [Proteobacteria bacterium]|nr:ABC transporter substrate-binding protein [Pseudomonadota bacterium]